MTLDEVFYSEKVQHAFNSIHFINENMDTEKDFTLNDVTTFIFMQVYNQELKANGLSEVYNFAAAIPQKKEEKKEEKIVKFPSKKATVEPQQRKAR